MIRVEINGTKYRIEWEHFNQADVAIPGTECGIWEDTKEVIESQTPLVQGSSMLHPNDRFCKETGRKVSLTKAISDWPKEHRAAVWSAYFNRKGNQ